MALDLCVRGDVVTESEVLADHCVGVEEGRIVALGKAEDFKSAAHLLDCSGKLIFPGGVDAHVHAHGHREEGIGNATRAAAAGGVTTVLEHPIDVPEPATTAAHIKRKVEAFTGEAYVDFGLYAAVTRDSSLEDIAGCARAGIVGYKIFMDSSVAVMPPPNDAQLLAAFQQIATTGLVVGVHAENDSIVQAAIRRLRGEGRSDPLAHCESRPPVSETEAVARAIELAAASGVHLHFFHLSLPRSFDLVAHAREAGLPVTGEVCPHYLLLSSQHMDDLGARGKINPPLRDEALRKVLWDYFGRGEISMVASDHAPHLLSVKQAADIFDNPSGAPGVQTMFPMLFGKAVAAGHIAPPRLAQICCTYPARRFGLYPRKGALRVGADADLTVIDPQMRWTVTDDDMLSSAQWTPFAGEEICGSVVATIVRGEIVYRDGGIATAPGHGAFVTPVTGPQS